jgi:hypothetical protein
MPFCGGRLLVVSSPGQQWPGGALSANCECWEGSTALQLAEGVDRDKLGTLARAAATELYCGPNPDVFAGNQTR